MTGRRKVNSRTGRQEPLKTYKQLLQSILDQRPSGTRQRLAERLGKNRSFISQFSNPAYRTPIPSKHLEDIFEICHFSTNQKSDFIAAYRAAHPRRVRDTAADPRRRHLTIEVPDLGREDLNRELDELVREFALATSRLLRSLKPTAAARSTPPAGP